MNDTDSDELVCEVCKGALSQPPNEIVICDNCNKGFHQTCHTPAIPKEVIQQDCSWVCRQCYYVMTNEEKIKLNIISSESLTTKSNLQSKQNNSNGNHQIKSSKSLLINKNISSSNKFSIKNDNKNLLDSNLNNETNEICKKLPYNLNELIWDQDHLTNGNNVYCYCGFGIEYCRSMLQCYHCSQWFHSSCINSLKSELLIGDQYFKFVCSVCNEGSEICQRIIMKWSVVCGLILSNLTYGGDKRFFNIQDMILFLKENENQFKLNVPLNQLSDKELFNKLEMNLKDNKDNKFISKKENNEIKWALNVIIPYDDPLTFSPYSSNLSSTLVKQKSSTNSTATFANQTKSLANSKILLDGACRKNASKSPPKVDNKLINQINKSIKDNTTTTTTTKNKKKSNRRSNSVSSANSIEEPNLLELIKNKTKSSTPKRKTNSNSLLLRTTSAKHVKIKKEEEEEIKDLDSLIPFPVGGFDGPFNPFHDEYDKKQDIELKKKFKKELNDNKLNNETTENCLLNNNSTTINSLNQTINNNNSLMCNHNEKPNYRVVNNDGNNKLIISRVNNHENSFNSSNNLLNNQNYLNGNSNGNTITNSNSKLLNQHDDQFDGKMNFKILAQRKIINNEIEYMLEFTEKV